MRYIMGLGSGRALGAVVLVLSLAIGACGGDDDDDSAVEPLDDTTTTTIDVTTVPAVIDVRYVQAVMNALDKATGDAVRSFVASKGPNREWYDTFQAVFEEDLFKKLESEFGNFAARDLKPLRPTPGDPETQVKKLVDSSRTCVIGEVTRSFGPMLTEPPAADTVAGFIQLSAKRPDRDPGGHNPTPWAIVADIDASGATIPSDPCP